MNLLEFLKKNRDARKIFGERELKIIEKQLWGISLTQSEKNRLSRDIRKKFNFIAEVSKFYEEFELKKATFVKSIIDEAKKLILESKYLPRIKRIFLFGSTVENQRTFRSDIDIAIEFDEINNKEAVRFRTDMFFNDKVDTQVYNVLPEKIKKEIDIKGKILYEREDKRKNR